MSERLWTQQAQSTKKHKFKEASEVNDPDVVVDMRPDDYVAPELPTSPVEIPVAVKEMPSISPERLEKLQGLEDAAKLLMQYLPEDAQTRIHDAHREMSLPYWQLILGYTMRCRERDELFFPMILSMWEFALPANAPRPCASCGQLFTTKFGEGRYCCNACACGKIGTVGPEGPRDHAVDCTTRKMSIA